MTLMPKFGRISAQDEYQILFTVHLVFCGKKQQNLKSSVSRTCKDNCLKSGTASWFELMAMQESALNLEEYLKYSPANWDNSLLDTFKHMRSGNFLKVVLSMWEMTLLLKSIVLRFGEYWKQSADNCLILFQLESRWATRFVTDKSGHRWMMVWKALVFGFV